MKKSFACMLIVLPAFLLGACGTSRKLEQSNKDLAQQKEINAQQTQKINTLESDNKQLKEENVKYSKEAEDCRIAKEAIQKNLESMNNAISEGGAALEQIFEKMDTTRENFADAGVEVSYENGLIHISLHDQLMFKSGSSTIGVDGKNALAIVAQEFNKYPNITMYVIGNTDNKKVKAGSGFKDNWSLSTERANSIVRVLRDEYGVDPARIVSGGRSWYKPVGDNLTEEGRAQNRRTEIVINPNLERLWETSVKK